MVTEDHVSFKIAKLLKEKGFDETCRAFWKKWNGEINICDCNSSHIFEYCHNTMLEKYNDNEELNIAAPTLQMAMKWLRETHHYYIQVMLDSWALGDHMGYYVVVQKTDSDFEMMLSDARERVFYDTPEEAAEDAIMYIVKTLI